MWRWFAIMGDSPGHGVVLPSGVALVIWSDDQKHWAAYANEELLRTALSDKGSLEWRDTLSAVLSVRIGVALNKWAGAAGEISGLGVHNHANVAEGGRVVQGRDIQGGIRM